MRRPPLEFPDRYTKLSHLRDFHQTSESIGNYLEELSEDDVHGERADAGEWWHRLEHGTCKGTD